MERSTVARDRWYIWPPLAGYLCACVSASLVMATYLAVRSIGDAGPGGAFLYALIYGLPMMLLIAAPGFLLLRFALHRLRRFDPVSFALAGAANGYGVVSLAFGADTLDLYLKYPPDPAFAAAGAVGGVVCWSVERHMSRTAA